MEGWKESMYLQADQGTGRKEQVVSIMKAIYELPFHYHACFPMLTFLKGHRNRQRYICFMAP